MIDPPWVEYSWRIENYNFFNEKDEKFKGWPLEKIKKLKIPEISGNPCFLFLWAGSDHLEDARQLLNHWGYKRCEDICWLKTNKQFQEGDFKLKEKSYL